MRWALWLGVGCPRSEEKPQPVDTGETDTQVPPTGETGDTGSSPCEAEEVALDGRDGDCDGWADEFGTQWPRLTAEARLLATGPSPGWGEKMAVGLGGDGEVWVVGGGDIDPLGDLVALAPRTGQQVSILDDSYYDDFAQGITVGRFSGTEAFLAAWDYEQRVGDPPERAVVFLYDAQPTQQSPEDYLAYVEFTPETIGTDSMFVTGDLDGDGWDELLLREGDEEAWPYVRILDGASAGPVWSGSRATIRHDDLSIQNFAYFVGELADVSGDGISDIPIYSEEDGGRVWLVSGDVSGTVLVEDTAFAVLSGEVPDDDAGIDVAAGDADGDGYLDLLVGAPLAAARRGKSYLVLGPVLEDRELVDSAAQVVGDWDHDWCGAAQTFLSDADGDGADEPVVACSRDKYLGLPAPGRIMGYRGPEMAGVLGVQQAAALWVGDGPADLAGYQLHGDHDVDGDGRADLVVSVPFDNQQGTGAVYLLSGPSW